MPLTKQIVTQGGTDFSGTDRSNTANQKTTGTQDSTTVQKGGTDTTRSNSTSSQTDDFAFQISFSLVLRDAIPCKEIPPFS